MLPCKHFFCKECLCKQQGEAGHLEYILCPICLSPTKVDPLAKGIELLPEHPCTVSDLCQSCVKQAPAIKMCVTCDCSLCRDCVEAHGTIVTLAQHKVMEFEAYYEMKTSDGGSGSYCNKHSGCLVEYYCRTCDEVVCEKCCIENHDAHHPELITDTLTDKCRTEVLEMAKTANDKSKELDNLKTNFEEATSRLMKEHNEVKRHHDKVFEMCVKELDKFKALLKKDLNAAFEDKLHHLNRIENKMNKVQDTMNTKDLLSKELNQAGLADMLRFKRVLENSISSTMDITPDCKNFGSLNYQMKNQFQLNQSNSAVHRYIGLAILAAAKDHNLPTEEACSVIKPPSLSTAALPIASLLIASLSIASLPTASIMSASSPAEPDQNMGVRVPSTLSIHAPPFMLPSPSNPMHSGTTSIHAEDPASAVAALWRPQPPQFQPQQFPPQQNTTPCWSDLSAGNMYHSPPLRMMNSRSDSRSVGVWSSDNIMLNNQPTASKASTNSRDNLYFTPTDVNQDSRILSDDNNISTPSVLDLNNPHLHLPPPHFSTHHDASHNYSLDDEVEAEPPKSTLQRNKMIYSHKHGEFGQAEGQFTEPSGVAVNLNNEVLVADTNNHRIQIFRSDGSFKTAFGEVGKRDGQLLYPNRVAVNPSNGDIVVTERAPTHQVQIFNANGVFIRKFGANLLEHPRGVAVDKDGLIIIIECKVSVCILVLPLYLVLLILVLLVFTFHPNHC